jgi:cation diffusion facilitator family transporter
VAERRTRIVIAITATMMVVEIAAGVAFNSMALLADGWPMSTHVAAFLITALAYYFSRRHSANPRYSFGTGKMGVLGGFASAVILSMIALLMAGESVHRMFGPLPIRFNDAIGVAVIGLLVNLVCALQRTVPARHARCFPPPLTPPTKALTGFCSPTAPGRGPGELQAGEEGSEGRAGGIAVECPRLSKT